MSVLLQLKLSVKSFYLGDISWLTADVHRLISCLSITKFNNLAVLEGCKLRYGLSPAASRISVENIDIQTSLQIETLQALLSGINVYDISFQDAAQVLNMDKYKHRPRQVSF